MESPLALAHHGKSSRTARRVVLTLVAVMGFGIAGGGPGLVPAADWPTHRGSVARTGNVDGGPGPAKPEVAWVQRAGEHYLASPSSDGQAVFVSALGAFNSAQLQALTLGGNPAQRVRWAKGPPYLKLPLVSSPAIAQGLLVFGDGMHQTDGAVLHALRADSGLPLWQFSVPGNLVHLEGGPAIADGKVYMGGGNAGVLCVDTNRLELDGRQVDRAAVEDDLRRRWEQLIAKYEQEKKVDPDFAVPPSEDALPKPRPQQVWQKGAGEWHVDAPLAVVGGFVYVASAFLDAERTGERALLALDAKDGRVVWKTSLNFNPWSGPTVAGDLILIGGSNIRLEPRDIPQGRGEVLAIQRTDGRVKWRRDVPGGVVSSIATVGSLLIFTATDGKVRAWDVATGQDRWTWDGGAPYFAGPAVAGTTVYCANLQGVVHALNLADGQSQWQLALASHPDIRAPGQVYGSPIVVGGRLIVATCNLAATGERQPTVVVCIGPKQ